MWSSRQENDLIKSYEGGEILSHWRTVCHLLFPLTVCVRREFRAAQDPEEPQARTTVMESTSVTVDPNSSCLLGQEARPFPFDYIEKDGEEPSKYTRVPV